MKNKKSLKCLSFFSGAMGLDLGLEGAGIEILLASEIDKHCQNTIRTNRPDLPLIGDIRDYSADDIRSTAGLRKNSVVDIMAGGPPCQAFSTAGKRKAFEDERGNVFLKYIDLICEIRPRFAVIENVRGLLSAPLSHRPHSERGKNLPPLSEEESRGSALAYIIAKLRENNFGVSFNLYNSANFGSPQIRERVVMLCCRDGETMPFLSPTHAQNGGYGLKKWVTLRKAFTGLSRHGCDHIDFPQKRLKYYKLLSEGQNWRNLPEKLQKEALGKSYFSGGGKTGFLRRLAWDKPSPTLVTNPAMPATDLCHPSEDRPLSIQEYKRIQEFPDTWEITGPILQQYRQIGNAVPCSLGKAIGRLLIDYSERKAIPTFDGFPYSRYLNTDHDSWEKDIFGEETGQLSFKC